jgi:multidrug efflux pump subunit AcrB
MHALWNFFLDKRAFTILVMIALTIGGTFSLVSIPKESSPEVIIPVGIVSTILPGGSAEDIEQLITNKIEDEVKNLENIDTITSSSREGVSIVSAQFLASADIDKSIQDLKDAVDRAKTDFPREALDPTVTRVNFADQPILIISLSQDVSPRGLTELGDFLKNEIESVPGVSRVDVSGTRKREIQVILRQSALDQYGLSTESVSNIISASNASFPIGNITVSNVEYPVKFSGSLEEASDVERIAIPTPSGIPLRLKDIADVVDGLEKPVTFSRISENGAPASQALTLSIYKKEGGDVTAITDAVKERLKELSETSLAGANTVISFDRGDLVKKDLRELIRVGFETVVLVMLILFLTIGWRESLVAGLSIPLSFVIAFIGLDLSGNTINFISLFSLILAVGILVDSGIVVTEAIHARYKKYGDAHQAAVAAIKEYAWPLIAGTMTTVAVFVPLFFISGITGKFIASIPFTIIFVLLASIWVALGMVPLLAIMLTKRSMNRMEARQEELTAKAQAWYRAFLARILDNDQTQKWFIRSMLGGFVIAILLPATGLVKVTFFPQSDQDFVYIEIERPQGSTLQSTDLATREVEEFLYEYPYARSFVTTVGASSAFNNQGGGTNPKYANITVNLLPADDRPGVRSSDIIEQLRERFMGITSATVRVVQTNNGPPVGSPIVIKLLGEDLRELSIAADKAERLLQSIPGTVDVETSLRDDGTEFRFTIDRERTAEAGLTPAQVAQALRIAVNGSTVTTIRRLGEDIDILMKLNLNPNYNNPEDTSLATVDDIRQVVIRSPRGPVLLGTLLDVSAEPTSAVIRHENSKRVVTVSSKLTKEMTAKEVVAAFKKRVGELELPESVMIDFGGENEEVNRSFRDMFFALIAGMVLMLGILVLEFNSFRFALYLLSIVPLSLIGVLGGLALVGQPLSFPSMLGFIALSGVIINHAIILLDSIIHMLERDHERPLREVILDASVVRLRPIFLTTITTVIGMVPLAFVSAIWGPLAFAIMFGLSFAMLLTLVLLPVLFWRYPGKYANKVRLAGEAGPMPD